MSNEEDNSNSSKKKEKQEEEEAFKAAEPRGKYDEINPQDEDPKSEEDETKEKGGLVKNREARLRIETGIEGSESEDISSAGSIESRSDNNEANDEGGSENTFSQKDNGSARLQEKKQPDQGEQTDACQSKQEEGIIRPKSGCIPREDDFEFSQQPISLRDLWKTIRREVRAADESKRKCPSVNFKKKLFPSSPA